MGGFLDSGCSVSECVGGSQISFRLELVSLEVHNRIVRWENTSNNDRNVLIITDSLLLCLLSFGFSSRPLSIELVDDFLRWYQLQIQSSGRHAADSRSEGE